MNKRVEYMLNRLKEPSTWRGIISFSTLLGVIIVPEVAELIISAGVTAVSLILMGKKDAGSPDA